MIQSGPQIPKLARVFRAKIGHRSRVTRASFSLKFRSGSVSVDNYNCHLKMITRHSLRQIRHKVQPEDFICVPTSIAATVSHDMEAVILVLL